MSRLIMGAGEGRPPTKGCALWLNAGKVCGCARKFSGKKAVFVSVTDPCGCETDDCCGKLCGPLSLLLCTMPELVLSLRGVKFPC